MEIKEEYLSYSKGALMEKAYELGYNYEQLNYGCGQCVLASLQDIFGLDDAVFKSATALAAGLGLSCEGTCGAVTAGTLFLSYHIGRERNNFSDKNNIVSASKWARKLSERFKEKYDSIYCSQIQQKILGRSFNLLDKDDFAAFEAAGGHADKCPAVVGDVCRLVVDLMFEIEENNK